MNLYYYNLFIIKHHMSAGRGYLFQDLFTSCVDVAACQLVYIPACIAVNVRDRPCALNAQKCSFTLINRQRAVHSGTLVGCKSGFTLDLAKHLWRHGIDLTAQPALTPCKVQLLCSTYTNYTSLLYVFTL